MEDTFLTQDTSLPGSVSSGAAEKNLPTGSVATNQYAPVISTSEKAETDIGKIGQGLQAAKQGIADQAATKANAPQPQISVTDFLASKGQPSDFASRAKLAQQYGISNYTGTADQNTKLLGILQNASQKTAPTAPTGTTGQPAGEIITTSEAFKARFPNAVQTGAGIFDTGTGLKYQLTDNGYQQIGGTQQAQGQLQDTPPQGMSAMTTPAQDGYKWQYDSVTGKATQVPMTQEESLLAQKDAINQKIDDSINAASTLLNEALTGTIPLNDAQKAQIAATQAQFDQLRQAQIIANNNYTESIKQAGLVSGRSMYAPEVEAGNIAAAVNLGIQKLAAIDTQAAKAIADMENGFETNNFNLVKSANDAYQAALKDKADSIQKMYDDVVAAKKAAQDATHQQISDAIAQGNFELDKIKVQIQNSQLDETTRHNLVQEAIAADTAAKGRYEVVNNPDGTQSIFDKSNGAFVGQPSGSQNGGMYTNTNPDITPGNTGDNLLDNNTSRTYSGIYYIDGSSFTGKTADQMQRKAAVLGIPYIPKTKAQALELMSSARGDMKAVLDNFISFGATDATGRILGAADRKVADVLQTNENIASWGAFRAAAIKTVQAIASGGTGLRINQAEIDLALKNDIPNVNDTVGVANGKLAKLQSLMDSNEAAVFGGEDKWAWMKAASSPDPLKTYANSSDAHAKLVSQAVQQNPSFTNQQIMQILPGDISSWKFPIANNP